jgi:chaperone BCS1
MNFSLAQLGPTIALMSVGALMYLLRAIPTQLLSALGWYATVTLTVNNDDPCFDWINEWLATHAYAKRARMLKVESGRESSEHWTVSPGYGTHWFWDHGLVFITRSAVENKSITWRRQESFIIRTIGRNQSRIREIIDYASFAQKQADSVGIRMWLSGAWMRLRGKTKRALDTVYLPEATKQELVDCTRWFFDGPEWFAKRGIPYRQGFLFFGPPGTGKTTIVIALASEFGKPIYILNLATLKDDNELLMALSMVPHGAIVLIEDVDAAKASEVRTEDAEQVTVDKGVTLSGLLNAIDGVAAPEGRLLIMTTNHPDKIDPAIIRSARVDKRFFFGSMTKDLAVEMSTRLFPEPKPGLMKAISDVVGEYPAASWQDAFMAVERSGNVDDLPKELAIERPEIKPIRPSGPAAPTMGTTKAAA